VVGQVGDCNFGADDGADCPFLGDAGELHRSGQIVVVGEGKRAVTELIGAHD
jgi:hypothetical protein